MCLKPYKQGVAEYGCGQCLSCRVNRRRLWAARIVLESFGHDFSWFVTLTYSPEALPADGSVSPVHLRNYLKRLRKQCCDPVRFYAVGEYGEKSLRPHYHLILFGVAPVQLRHVVSTWAMGIVHIGEVTLQSAAYCAAYVQKGMTRASDPRLGGLHPEFCRMSLRPGIGAREMDANGKFGQFITSKAGSDYLVANGDVPLVFRTDGKLHPLGRYLRRRLRASAGMEDLGEPVSSLDLRMRAKVVEMTPLEARRKLEVKRELVKLKLEHRNKIRISRELML